MHDFSYPLSHIVTAVYWQCAKDGGLHLTIAETGWAKASWGKIYGQWLAGSAVFAFDFDYFDAKAIMEAVAKYRVTTFCAPPTFFRFVVKNGLERYDFSSVEHVTTAGETLSPDIMQTFYEKTGLTIMEGYGQTETAMLIGTLSNMKPRFGSMGKKSPMYDIDLIDEDGNICTDGVPGEIVIRPGKNLIVSGICSGYPGSPEEEKRAWENGVYHTGDIAVRDGQGYFSFVGRRDDIIKSSGYRISPYEVENILIKHNAILECAVTGIPENDRGVALKATVVLKKEYAASETMRQDIMKFAKENAAAYKVPKIIVFTDELPKTISGKIKRHKNAVV